MDTCLATLADYAEISVLLKECNAEFDLAPDHLEHTLLVRSGRNLVGMVHMRFLEQCAVGLCLVIRPGFRRMGLGKQLGQAMLEHCRHHCVPRLFVYSDVAPFYYRTLGYKPFDLEKVPPSLLELLQELRGDMPLQPGHLLEFQAKVVDYHAVS